MASRLAWRAMFLAGLLCINSGLFARDQAEAPTVDSFVKSLSSEDEAIKISAVDALGTMKSEAAPATAALAKVLSDDKSPVVRAHAAMALGQIGEEAKAAGPALAKAVVDPDSRVRRMALKSIRKVHADINVTLPVISQALADADPSVRVSALHNMANLGESAIPALLKVLDHPEGKYWGLLVIGEMGPKAKAAVPTLVKLLSDDSPAVRREAEMALGAIGPDAESAIPSITKLLKDPEPSVRFGANYTLGNFGPAAKSAVPELEVNLKDGDEFTKVISSWTLVKIKDKDPATVDEAVKVLTEGVASDNAYVRRVSIRALSDLRLGPAKILPALRVALEKADPHVIYEAMDALADAGEAGKPFLIAALKKEKFRGKAASLLGRMGKDAASAVPALTEALEDKNPEVQNEICMTLAAIGPDAASAVPTLIKLLESDEDRAQFGAAYALGRIGPKAKEAVPALVKELEDNSHFERNISAWALAHIVPDDSTLAKKITPILIAALKNDQAMVRAAAAGALGQLGPGAADASEALEALSKDPEESVRNAASEAIKKIKG